MNPIYYYPYFSNHAAKSDKEEASKNDITISRPGRWDSWSHFHACTNYNVSTSKTFAKTMNIGRHDFLSCQSGEWKCFWGFWLSWIACIYIYIINLKTLNCCLRLYWTVPPTADWQTRWLLIHLTTPPSKHLSSFHLTEEADQIPPFTVSTQVPVCALMHVGCNSLESTSICSLCVAVTPVLQQAVFSVFSHAWLNPQYLLWKQWA